MAKPKKVTRRFKGKGKLPPKVKSKMAKTNYTGPTPRQNLATSIARRNRAEDEALAEKTGRPVRTRRIAIY
jgi:hypothetical protein